MQDLNGYRRIYIRHADKEYANGDSEMYKHDPGITPGGIEKTKLVTRHLVQQWGQPERIIASPYRRTRETAKTMLSVLDTKVKIHIDTDLSEYLGNHRGVPIDVTESTLVHDPPHPETFSDMKRRVRKHHNKILKYSQKQETGVIWIVTHGLVIKQLASLIDMKLAREFPPLTCLSISDGETITKAEVLMLNTNRDHSSDSSDSDSGEDRDDNYPNHTNPNHNRLRRNITTPIF